MLEIALLVLFTLVVLGLVFEGPPSEKPRTNERTEQSHVDERRAIADATIASMRAGTFYGNGKQIVEDARRPFKDMEPK